MSMPYICSACRSQAARQSAVSLSKRQVALASSHALDGIVSDSPSVTRQRQSSRYSRPSQNATSPRNSAKPPARRQNKGASDDFTAYIASATTTSSNIGRYSRAPTYSQRPAAVVNANNGTQTPSPQSRPRPRSHASELEGLLEQGELDQAWRFFQEHYADRDSPALKNPPFQDVAKIHSGQVFARLLSDIVTSWTLHLNSSHQPTLPSPLEVVKSFNSAGIASSAIYSTAIWNVSVALFDPTKYGDSVSKQKHLDSLQELMDLWRLCLSRQSLDKHDDADTQELDPIAPWSFVHADLLIERRRRDRRSQFDDVFALFVPSAQAEKGSLNHLAASALLTFDLLTHLLPETLRSKTSTEPYMEFTKSIDLLLVHTMVDMKRLHILAQHLKGSGISADVVDGFLERLKGKTHQPVAATLDTERPESLDFKSASQRVINQLGNAVERQDLDSVETLWRGVQDLLRLHHAALAKENTAVNLYEQFLLAFFSLRRPQAALLVWNAMIQSGIQPTVSTWSIMMKGCHISRDIHIQESMWRRMRDSGVEPDVQAWSTRIHGLLKVGKFREGLVALDEMGREWMHAAKQQRTKDILGVPKPNTAILNSAVVALGARGKQYIPKVLAWSNSFAIEPDVITYNALLNISLATGQQAETVQILKSMADSKVKPDSATMTIMINSMFHADMLRGLDHAEQEVRVMQFIDSLESDGVSIDVKGYGLLVDRLLKEYGNLAAVKKIMAHMATKNVEPTAHIYTIFMTYYFDLTPPDLYAVDALWNQIRSRNKGYGQPVDVIFYDRMVEGYARHGDVGRTMTFLTRMSKEGKRPGWLAMISVAKCLAENNEWDRLTQVVMDCHKHEGLLSAGLRGRKGQREFWRLVRSLGVLDNLAIDVAE